MARFEDGKWVSVPRKRASQKKKNETETKKHVSMLTFCATLFFRLMTDTPNNLSPLGWCYRVSIFVLLLLAAI